VKGGLTWGANIDVAYFDQELSTLDPEITVIEEIAEVAPQVVAGELRGYLARFLFTGDDIFKPVAALSGGEQSRLALARIIYSRANVLVFDEPTNHLDIPSREALERALAEYTGTIITVSHDRYFLDKLATEILHFENGAATYHNGSYSDYYATHHQKQEIIEGPPRKQPAAPRPEKPRPVNPQKQRRRPPEQIEQEIHVFEQEMAELSEKLANPSADWGPDKYAEIVNRQNAITSELDKLYQEWEDNEEGAEARP